MRVVHSLEGDSRVIAIEVAVLYEVLDGIDNLGGVNCGFQPGANSCTFLRMSACSRRASNMVIE